MNRTILTLAGLAAFMTTALVGQYAGAWQATTVPATRKVVPTGAMNFRTSTSATMEGARDEWEAFQVIIKSETPVNGINVTVSDLSDGAGHQIPASAFRLYREWFLNIVDPSGGGLSVTNHERVAGLYPDPLIPFVDPYSEETVQVGAPFDLTTADPGLAVVWVEVLIPADLVPGTYSGTATVTATDQTDIAIPIELNVWELNIPHERNIATSFGFSEGGVRGYHGGTDGSTTDADFPEIIRNYYKALHEHRMDPTTTRGPVTFEFDRDGNLLPVDWTAYDEYMQTRLDGTYFGDTTGIARFDAGMFAPGHGTGEWTDAQYQAAAAAYVNHLDAKGWIDRMWTYSTDEPWLNGGEETWNRVIREAGLLHDASPLWTGKVLVTGPMYQGAEEVVDIWCPVNPMYDDWFYYTKPYPGRGDYDTHMANDGELWFYNCNGNFPPYPGYDIDTAIGFEPRILKWGSFYEHATGFLHWHTNYWNGAGPWNCWQSIDTFGVLFARNGDGMLFYPGDSNGTNATSGTPSWLHIDGPVTSFRMKQVRDGLEDWELFIMAEKAGIGDWLRTEIERAYLRFGDYMVEDCQQANFHCADREPWTIDEDVLADVRHRIAMKLLFTLYPNRYDDPDAPVVVETVEQAGDDIVSDQGPAQDTVTNDIVADTAGDAVTDSGSGDEGGETRSTGGCSSTAGGAASPFAILLVVVCAALILRRRGQME